MTPAAPEPKAKRTTYSENMACMRKMGARRFIPLPEGNHKYLAFKQWPLVIRLYSWMVDHTVNWPTLNPYAVAIEGYDAKTGQPFYIELHLENTAQALGADIANLRKAWNLGVRMKLWGNQPHADNKDDKYRGRRRMYFYGAVDLELAEREAGKPEPEDLTPETTPETYEKVCANLFGASIWKQIKDRPKTDVESWVLEERRELQAVLDARADIDAAFRFIADQRKDTRWLARGVKTNRQDHQYRNGHAAAHRARQALLEEFYLPQMADAIQQGIEKRFAQTSGEGQNGYAQSENQTLRKHASELCANFPSLLTDPLPDKGQTIVPKSDLERAGGSDKDPPAEQQSPPKYLPAGTEQAAKPGKKQEEEKPERPLTPEEQEAAVLLFQKVREYQLQFPGTQFGSTSDLVDPARKCDQVWARLILEHVTPADMAGYLYDCGVKLGALPNALGKLPRPTHSPVKKPGDRFIGLFVDWAVDWARPDQRERRERETREAAEARERVRQREEAARQANNEWAQKQEEQWEATKRHMGSLPAEEQEQLLAQAREKLNKDAQVSRSYRGMNAEQKRQLELQTALKILQCSLYGEDAGGMS